MARIALAAMLLRFQHHFVWVAPALLFNRLVQGRHFITHLLRIWDQLSLLPQLQRRLTWYYLSLRFRFMCSWSLFLFRPVLTPVIKLLLPWILSRLAQGERLQTYHAVFSPSANRQLVYGAGSIEISTWPDLWSLRLS